MRNGEAAMRMTRVEQRELTRQRVVDAAEQLFTERGFLAVTVDQIAALAGFTIGAVYSNFAGKDELFMAVIDRWSETDLDLVRSSLEPGATDAARLDAFRRWADADLDQLLSRLRPEVEFLAQVALKPELAARVQQRQRGQLTVLAGLLAEQCKALGGTPSMPDEDLALAVASLANGLILQRLIDPQVDVGRVFGAALTALLGGVFVPDQTPPPTTSGGGRRKTTRSSA